MHSYTPEGTAVEIGDQFVTVIKKSGQTIVAGILEKRLSADGNIASILLDRLIHDRFERFQEFTADGCFVTEFKSTHHKPTDAAPIRPALRKAPPIDVAPQGRRSTGTPSMPQKMKARAAAAALNEKLDRAKDLLTGNLAQFIGPSQKSALGTCLRGEEREYFADLLINLADRIEKMPRTYEQDGKGGAATVHLHYFRGNGDWYITEKDSEPEHHQAFGWADLGHGGELGYISIIELTQNNVELDLHWTPKPLSECQSA